MFLESGHDLQRILHRVYKGFQALTNLTGTDKDSTWQDDSDIPRHSHSLRPA